MEVLKTIPVSKDYLWGGSVLKERYGKKIEGDILAESWEISIHPDGIVSLEGKDEDLKDYLLSHPDFTKELDILVKFIDAGQSLSIQVHPDEEYARRVEHDSGKTEMWYIIDADEDAFIYYGVKEKTTRDEFKKAIGNNTVLGKLNKVSVKKGDYFLIEAGTIHAIGKGCLILETQQSSNVTYRVYDYDRRDANGKKRELHVEKALDVISYEPVKYQNSNVNGRRTLMVDTPLFKTTYLPVKGKEVISHAGKSYLSLTITEGEGSLEFCDQSFSFRKGDSFLFPAKQGDIIINGNCEGVYTVK